MEVVGHRGSAGVQAAAATASNDGDEQRGRGGAVDDGGAPANARPNERVRKGHGRAGSRAARKWRRLDGGCDGYLDVDLRWPAASSSSSRSQRASGDRKSVV